MLCLWQWFLWWVADKHSLDYSEPYWGILRSHSSDTCNGEKRKHTCKSSNVWRIGWGKLDPLNRNNCQLNCLACGTVLELYFVAGFQKKKNKCIGLIPLMQTIWISSRTSYLDFFFPNCSLNMSCCPGLQYLLPTCFPVIFIKLHYLHYTLRTKCSYSEIFGPYFRWNLANLEKYCCIFPFINSGIMSSFIANWKHC